MGTYSLQLLAQPSLISPPIPAGPQIENPWSTTEIAEKKNLAFIDYQLQIILDKTDIIYNPSFIE